MKIENPSENFLVSEPFLPSPRLQMAEDAGLPGVFGWRGRMTWGVLTLPCSGIPPASNQLG